MLINMKFDRDEVHDMIETACDSKRARNLKNKMFVEYLKAIVNAYFTLYDSTTAFCQSMFFLDDLMNAKTITPEQVKELDMYIHLKAL